MHRPISQLMFLAVLLVVTISGCKKEEEENPGEQFDRSAMLANYADNVIVPRYDDLNQKMDALSNAVSLFTDDPQADHLEQVRTEWQEAYLAWQRCSMFEFGPAANVLLRSTCNTFPTDTADINSNIASGTWVLDAASNIDAIGFPAIDYLLFGLGLSDAQVVSLFSVAPNAENRRAYLSDVVAQVKSSVNAVYTEWNSSYRDAFVSNTGTDIGSALSMLVNELNFDYELIKNAKIGIPLGVQTLGIAIPEYVEAYYSGISKSLALECLRANRDVYLGRGLNGTDRNGLDDYLVFLGAQHNGGTLNNAILNQFELSEAALAVLSDPLSQQISSNPAAVENAYNKLQQHVVLYKTDMASALGVLITYSDGDGD